MRIVLLVYVLLMASGPVSAGMVRVAVAANFTAPMKELVRRFEASSGHRTVISFGSTGKLYAQIKNGAPFDVFLAADQARPRLLYEEGLAALPFTYAVGQLVLWSTDPALIDPTGEVLTSQRFERLAIANPKTAPYGAAAMQVLAATKSLESAESRLVRGDNVAQTFQFVLTGNAQLGFVAMSQVVMGDGGSRWIPPPTHYDPIRQDAVLLEHGIGNPAAAELLAFLRSESARNVIRRLGYGVD